MNPDSRSDLLLAARGSGLKILGLCVRGVGALCISILITRLVGAAEFGQYAVGLTSSELLAQVAGLGLYASVLRFIPIARQQDDAGWLVGLVRSATLIPAACGLVLGLAMYVFAEPIAARILGNPALAPLLRVFAVAVPMSALMSALDSILRAYNRVDRSIIGSEVGFHGPKLVLAAGALLAGYGIIGVAAAHIAALAISVLLLARLMRSLLPARSAALAPTYRMAEVWHQSLPVFVTQLFRTFGGRLELLLLGVFGLAINAGVYAAALQISMVGQMLPEALITVAMPLIAGAHHRAGNEEVRPLLHATTRWCLTATMPYFAVVVLFSDGLLGIFGREFLSGRTGLLFLAAMPLLNSAAGVAAAVLNMTGRASLNTFNAFAYLVTTVVLDLALIPRFGMDGAALAAFGSTLLLNLLRVAEVRWLMGIWPIDGKLARPLAAVAFASLVGLCVRMILPGLHPVAMLVIGGGVLGITYLGALYGLGATVEDRVVLDAIGRNLPAFARRFVGVSRSS